ncbi:MAG TPA: hypothetical protein DCG19_05290 [Cryomorphaceae bacterium]|nr:hypothetical protein [Owenweeksia sp.]HAD96799.1 hypothetical protein [Cryomorphaceae bacterium]HBF21531.1 hypothetical protein [Cryomorphaceae bacterium]|tara:strand:+ start:159 stop:707 length:549 start_codon:yes stop_codon:yes gene_type:complete
MKKLFQFILPGILLIGFSMNLKAQEGGISNKLALGFELTQIQRDFGVGMNLASPYFLYDNVAIRVRGNMMFYEHIDEGEFTWTPYSNFTIGLVGSGVTIADAIRLYGEGGLIGLIPSSTFSSEDISLGGYGLFGFEFYFCETANYFIEIGGAGTSATADKLPARPIYSNGFMINVGFRFHFQ